MDAAVSSVSDSPSSSFAVCQLREERERKEQEQLEQACLAALAWHLRGFELLARRSLNASINQWKISFRVTFHD